MYDVMVGAFNPVKNVVELEGLDGTFAKTVSGVLITTTTNTSNNNNKTRSNDVLITSNYVSVELQLLITFCSISYFACIRL